MELNESKLYKELGLLTKDKGRWKENIPYVSSLLSNKSIKIQAKALWLLVEMGLEYPSSVKDAVPQVVSFLDSNEPLLRERAINALGRITLRFGPRKAIIHWMICDPHNAPFLKQRKI
jgi:hypothetical protein